jgi:hypothetical protein
MFIFNAYVQLQGRTTNEKISEAHFYELIMYFQESLLNEIDFWNRLKLHRKPVEFLNGILQELYDSLRMIQQRPEMRDIKENQFGYVHTEIIALWNENRRLGNLYFSTEKYCHITRKDFNTIATHIAEYRALNKLEAKLRGLISKSRQAIV